MRWFCCRGSRLLAKGFASLDVDWWAAGGVGAVLVNRSRSRVFVVLVGGGWLCLGQVGPGVASVGFAGGLIG